MCNERKCETEREVEQYRKQVVENIILQFGS